MDCTATHKGVALLFFTLTQILAQNCKITHNYEHIPSAAKRHILKAEFIIMRSISHSIEVLYRDKFVKIMT